MFNGWQTFYQMTGEAAATLTGLLFIVASLTAGRQGEANDRGVRLFTTPTVFHLASVLVVRALALAPDGEGRSRAALMFAWSLLGLAYTCVLASGDYPWPMVRGCPKIECLERLAVLFFDA